MKTKQRVFWVIGKNYCIRTVTMMQVGTLVGIDEHEILLENCAWVADSGRFAVFLKTGSVSEVEPFPDGLVAIGRGSLVDACVWTHLLFREQK